MSYSSSHRRPGSSDEGTTGGFSRLDEGKKPRYVRTALMHSSSSATSRSATPLTFVWTSDPPMSSAVTSSPTATLTRGGPPRAMCDVAFTIGTKSARPGMYAVPAAPGSHHGRDLGDHAAHVDLLP